MEVAMSKLVRAGFAALMLTGASFVADAQVSFAESAKDRLTATELETLTDARIALVRGALQLTAEQEKLWPAVEEAIRNRAAGRQARLASAQARADEMRGRNVIENLRNRDQSDFLRRRADALSQRSAELRRLADAWQPLYQTLTADQKQRLGVIAILAFRDLRDRAEDRRLMTDEDEED